MLAIEGRCGKAGGSTSARCEQFIDVDRESSLIDHTVVHVDQIALGPEKEGDRGSNTSVCSGNLPVAVEEMVESQSELVEEFLGIGLIVLDVDTYELDPVPIFHERLVQDGGFGATGQTPRGPDVHNGRFAYRLEMRLELLRCDRRQVGTRAGFVGGPAPILAPNDDEREDRDLGDQSSSDGRSWHSRDNEFEGVVMPP